MLSFTSKEEKKLFAKYYSTISKKTESDLAIWWCNHVDGVNIFPKLPVHFRMYLKQWLKNKRIENSIKAAKPGAEKLNETNNILSPFYSKESTTIRPETSEELKHQEVSFTAVVRPPVMPQPSQQATHDRPYTVVDGILVGDNPGSRDDHKDRAR